MGSVATGLAAAALRTPLVVSLLVTLLVCSVAGLVGFVVGMNL